MPQKASSGTHSTFVAGSADDPRKGVARCLTCQGSKIVKYQEPTKLWTFVDGSTHTGHELELPTEELESDSIQIPTEPPIAGLSALLGHVVKLYQAMGLVEEERNIAQLFLTCLTRHLPAEYRRHVITQGESGSGKTVLVRTVLKAFWEDVENYTRVTGAGLDRKEGSLDGKILFLEQLEGSEPGQLKYLMTEGKLTILTADRDSSGRIVSHAHQLDGEPIVISTLVGAVIDSQFLNRVSTLEIDESEAQTAKITHHKLEAWSSIKKEDQSQLELIKQIDDKCWELGQHVAAIKIPFAMQLEAGLPRQLTMRRGTDRILSLLGAIAFVKGAVGMRPLARLQHSRFARGTYVLALPEDLTDALYVLGDAFADSLTYFFAKSKQIYDELCKISPASSRDIATQLKISQNRAREYLNSLVDLGYATKTKDKGVFRYEPKSHEKATLKLQASYSEAELKQWFEQQFPDGDTELVIPEAAKSSFTPPQSAEECDAPAPKTTTIREIGVETVTENQTVPKTGRGESTQSTVTDTVSPTKPEPAVEGR